MKMQKALNYVKIIGWESIILGAFLAIKIPESILTLLILSRVSTSVIDVSKQTETLQTILDMLKTFGPTIIIVLIMSITMIYAGMYLIKKKIWARNALEITYWIVLVLTSLKLLKYFYLMIKNPIPEIGLTIAEAMFVQLMVALPFIVIIAIATGNIVMLRNKQLKKILTK